MNWYIMMEFLWVNLEMDFTLKGTILRVILHKCFLNIVTYFSVLLFPFSSISAYFLSCIVLDFHMSLSPLPYVGFVDGATRNTQNLASISWEMYTPTNELIIIHAICLGRATNNIVEYSAVIELTEAISLGICRLVVLLDSQLMVLQLSNICSI